MGNVVKVIKKEKMDEFTTHLNSRNPSIKFMVEFQQEAQRQHHLPVVYVDIRWEDGSSLFKIYKTKTHTDQYLNLQS